MEIFTVEVLDNMKIAVYSIAKNEGKHVDRYMDSIKDADMVIVGVCTDTTDNTKELLEKRGAEVIDITVSPWRFDLARNLVLQHVPEDVDVCIALDLDEVLLPGWRQGIEEDWKPGTTMIRYPYIFNWQDNGMTKPKTFLYGFKIHARHAYYWKYPIHECLEPIGEENEIISEKVVMHHYPDWTKPRKYQEMLDRAVEEDPTCQRMSHLRGRELFMYNRHQEAIEELRRHLTITQAYVENFPGEGQTRSMSMRYIARCLHGLKADNGEIITWLLRAAAESPNQREPWIWLGQAWFDSGNYASAYAAIMNGLSITNKALSIECEEICWGEYPTKLTKAAYELITLNKPN